MELEVTNRKDSRSSRDVSEAEQAEKKHSYPFSVFFIVGNEFCERFNFYGMRTILSLYLTNILLYSNTDAKVIYHSFTMLVYFFPVFGAIISDSFLGKFRTIFYISIIYAAGSILLSLASADPIGLPPKEFSIIGLLLIAIGTGGIKPCVSAFGGDQFVLPQQEKQLARFFSLFYFSINAGSLISTFLTPVLRENVHCFDKDSCFPLAFSVPGILMVTSIVIFGLGKPLYKIKQPEGNVVVQVSKCIGHSVKNKIKSKEKKEHWLDHAEDKYEKKFIDDIKATLKVMILYTPLPIFWTLYDQQGTAWTFQAVRMDGDIGFYTILPDQMQVINPLLILAFIPLFSYVVYPALEKCHLLKKPLQRMTCGGLLAAVAFAVSAVVSIAIEATDPVLPGSGVAQIRLYNPLSCNITIAEGNIVIPAGDIYENKGFKVEGNESLSLTFSGDCLTYTSGIANITDEKTFFGIFTDKELVFAEDDITKDEKGLPRIRVLFSVSNATNNVTAEFKGETNFKVNNSNTDLRSVDPGTYKIGSDEFSVKLGGVYTIMLSYNGETYEKLKMFTVTESNSINMLWLLPQYIIITAAEIMFSITGLEFSYSQAPISMKSVLQAAYLLTDAIGNLIIVIIESARIFDKQSSDYFLYAALMVADMVLFAFMAYRYKYVQQFDEDDTFEDSDEIDDENNVTSKKSSVNGISNPNFEKDDKL